MPEDHPPPVPGDYLDGVPEDQQERLKAIRHLTHQLGCPEDPQDLVSSPVFTSKWRRMEPVGLAVLDRQLTYLAVNQILARMNNRPVQDHIGRRMPDLFPELAGVVEALFLQIIRTKEPMTDEVLVTGHAGRGPEKWLVTYAPIINPDTGEVAGFSCAVREAKG